MSSARFTPERDTLAARVCDWLSLHPGATLTTLQAQFMTALPGVNVATSLRECLDAGLLVAFGTGADRTYSAGPSLHVHPRPTHLPPLPHPPAAPPSSAASGGPPTARDQPAKAAKPTRRRKRRALQPLPHRQPGRIPHLSIDPTTVPLDNNVPVPLRARRPISHRTCFDSLFLRMQPGASVLIPADMISSVTRLAQTFVEARPEMAARFCRRAEGTDHFRFWRVN